MLSDGIAARLQADRQSVVNVAPVVRRGVRWIDAERFDLIDELKNPFDLGPAKEAQQTFAAGRDMRDGREGLTRSGRAQNVDPAFRCAKLIRLPADEGEDGPGLESDGAAAAALDRCPHDPAEANPVLDPLLDPDELGSGAAAHERAFRA